MLMAGGGQHPRCDRLPENADGVGLALMDAPTEVSETQLRELHIRIRTPPKIE